MRSSDAGLGVAGADEDPRIQPGEQGQETGQDLIGNASERRSPRPD